MRAARFLLSALLVATGALFSLYGVFALAYRGEGSGGNTTIEIGGGEMDAHLAGALSLVIAGVLFASGVLVARSRRI